MALSDPILWDEGKRFFRNNLKKLKKIFGESIHVCSCFGIQGEFQGIRVSPNGNDEVYLLKPNENKWEVHRSSDSQRDEVLEGEVNKKIPSPRKVLKKH